VDPAELSAQLGRFIGHALEGTQEAAAAEYLASSADDLVTARQAQDRTTVSIHVLAKRRLDREDLAAAIVEAVNAAEQKAVAASRAAIEEAVNDFAFRDVVGADVRQALDELQPRRPSAGTDPPRAAR
jgi:DNA-binding protein YbaB